MRGCESQLPEKNPAKLASFSACRLQCLIFAQLSFVTALGARVLWLLRDVLEREEKVHLLSVTLTPCTPSGARTHHTPVKHYTNDSSALGGGPRVSSKTRSWRINCRRPSSLLLASLVSPAKCTRLILYICNRQLINCKCTRTSGETETRPSAPCENSFFVGCSALKTRRVCGAN